MLAVRAVQQESVSEREDSMINQFTVNLRPFDEAEMILAQLLCQIQMENALDELRGLVLIADMPVKTRMHLMGGIDHILNHVRAETNELTAEAEGRLN